MVYSGEMLRKALLTLGMLGVAMAASAQTAAPVTPLSQARQAFNLGKYDQAITSALEARKVPSLASPAAVVLGRAYVERYHLSSDAADLVKAHAVFTDLDPSRLTRSERRDLTIGLGLTVFFEGRPGAAAELLEVALAEPPDAGTSDTHAREKLFDWWATAVDRAAQLAPESGRHNYYERIMKQSEAELARDPWSTTAGYWLAAGARGAAELDRAWHAAIAAWIRAKGAPGQASVRNDLDTLVTAAIIPERARALDPRAALALVSAMRAEWEQIKTSW